MIPDFDEYGNLPPGIHRATLEEIAERFGGSTEIRRVEMESLRWLVELARRAGAERLIINGSFVTDASEPNDVDCVVLMTRGFPKTPEAVTELETGLPFLDMHLVDQEDFSLFVELIFDTDQNQVRKGMVEVIL